MAFLLALWRRRDPLVQLAAYAAFLLQANTLFITAVHTGIARYTVPLTPLLFMFLLAMCVLAARLARGVLGKDEVHE